MTWSYIAKANGSSTATSFTPASWPTGVAEGDLVVFCQMFAPDSIPGEPTTTTTGWIKQNSYGGAARFMWTRYSAAQSLPTLSNSTSATVTYYLLAFRATAQVQVGKNFGVDSVGGSAPVATAYTTATPETLIVLFGSIPGDQGVNWAQEGSFTSVVNITGAGSGDANAPNIFIGYRFVSSPTAIAAMRAYLTVNRYYLLVAAEKEFNDLFHF